MHHNKETMDSGQWVLQLPKVEARKTENENSIKNTIPIEIQSFHETSMKMIALNKRNYVQPKFSSVT